MPRPGTRTVDAWLDPSTDEKNWSVHDGNTKAIVRTFGGDLACGQHGNKPCAHIMSVISRGLDACTCESDILRIVEPVELPSVVLVPIFEEVYAEFLGALDPTWGMASTTDGKLSFAVSVSLDDPDENGTRHAWLGGGKPTAVAGRYVFASTTPLPMGLMTRYEGRRTLRNMILAEVARGALRTCKCGSGCTRRVDPAREGVVFWPKRTGGGFVIAEAITHNKRIAVEQMHMLVTGKCWRCNVIDQSVPF